MAYRLPARLHRNRHGVLYFRLAVPADIQSLLGQREIYRSLSTSSVQQAADIAQAFKNEFGTIFRQLRELIMSEQETTAKAAWDDFVQLPDLRLRIKNAGSQIALEEQRQLLELREAESVNQNERHQRDLDLAIKVTALSSAPTLKRDTPTITNVWERYKAEKIVLGANGGWKDGEDTAKYDHWPHIRAFIELIGDKQVSQVTAEDAERFQAFILPLIPQA